MFWMVTVRGMNKPVFRKYKHVEYKHCEYHTVARHVYATSVCNACFKYNCAQKQ
jgi:hypothetical protein